MNLTDPSGRGGGACSNSGGTGGRKDGGGNGGDDKCPCQAIKAEIALGVAGLLGETGVVLTFGPELMAEAIAEGGIMGFGGAVHTASALGTLATGPAVLLSDGLSKWKEAGCKLF